MALRKKVRAQKRAQEQLKRQQQAAPPDNRIKFSDEQQEKLAEIKGLDYEQPQRGQSPETLPVNSITVEQAAQRLKKYRNGKARLEQRLVANEQYWKLRQWDYIDKKNLPKSDLKINTPWLWNCISAKHADLMDGYPETIIKPKREDDVAEAKKLRSIVPVVFEEDDYERTYSILANSLLKQGGCCAGVFWDGQKHDGLGDIVIRRVDPLNLFWEPGITDLQDSREVFHTAYEDNDRLAAEYPELEGKLGGKGITVTEYRTDDKIDYTNKSLVVEWYYKKRVDGTQVLHYCKFVEGNVLFSTENDPDGYPKGWYDHGEYPFHIEPLFPVEGSIWGYSYHDIGRGDQNAIDILTSSILSNAVENSTSRYFAKQNGGVNESEYLDQSKKIVHVVGNMDNEALREIAKSQLPNYVQNVRNELINEMKETLGNRDVSNGGTMSGVTAASAIAAMQEQSGKLSRVHNRTMYNLHRKIVNHVIELIRQFYNLPREIRITGDMGEEKFVEYDNRGLVPQPQPSILGMDMGLRLPCFDVEVIAAKQNPYTKLSQNELALQLYNAGVFAPDNTDQALALLKFMDFDHKDDVMQTVQQNGTMLQKYRQLQKVAFELAQAVDPMIAEQLAQAILMEQGQNPVGAFGADPQALNENTTTAEPQFIDKARAQAQQTTQI